MIYINFIEIIKMLMIKNDVFDFDHFHFAEYSNLENVNRVIINQIIDENS